MKKLICLLLLTAILCLSACNEVTSDNNVIVSGGLNGNLYLGDKVCDDKNPPFENISWEPGTLAIEAFTVKNEGDLVLKYVFQLNTEGISQALADCLRVVVIENYSENMTRDEAMALFDNLDVTSTVSSFSVSDVIEVKKSETFAVVMYFVPELAGNVTQDDVKDAKFGAQILVTQVSAEDDSFENDYDAN